MLMGLNLLSQPAQAISYNVSGNLADGGSVSGSFDYNPNNYTNWNISITKELEDALLNSGVRPLKPRKLNRFLYLYYQ